VQSSIAFTSIAGGNVAAAVCSATASNLLGIFATPILAGIFLRTVGGGPTFATAEGVLLQLLLPFVAGQMARPLIGAWTARNRTLLTYTDRGSIVLVVYTAFSAAVTAGLWRRVSGGDLVTLAFLDIGLLALVLGVTTILSRRLRFSRADEIVIVFCGSKKSLATGVPMAGILFPAHAVGMIVLPLMLFHQIQLMVCAALARSYAARAQVP
jgi:sodium/bile acid cotransporter 7